MREARIRFPSAKLHMEGLYHDGPSGRGVVITHPHPLYGGDMFNPVVEAIATAYRKRGFGTLRFNFRGVGNSEGTHSRGDGERDDLSAAIDYLIRAGHSEVHLSGYSFGAWVNAMALQNALPVRGMTMVAPPVAFIAFEEGIRLPVLGAVVAGSRDEFAPPAMIRPLAARWNRDARLDVIHGADHFFFGFLDEVTRSLVPAIPH